MLLSLYRTCSAGLAPFAPLALTFGARLRRARLRGEDRARIEERLGRSSLARPRGRIVWLHGAASADIASLLPLIDRLGSAGFRALVTTRDCGVRPRLPPTALHQYAPLDAPQFANRFLAFWRPRMALFAGCELRLNLIAETRRRGIPIALVNARLPARGFLLGRRAPRAAAALFRNIDVCLARGASDAERFRSLGVSRVEAAGDPIYDLAPPPADAPALARLAARLGARPAWAAFVVYESEEDLALAAHLRIARHFTDLVTIIVGRNANRGQEIALRAAKAGLDARLAADGGVGPIPAVYIAGPTEANLLYRVVGVAFLGKSLGGSPSGSTDRGGLNPIDAAKLGCAILRGPDVGDFADAYAALDAAGGCAVIHDAETLASEVSLLLFDAAELREMGRAAAEAVDRRGGASTRIIEAIMPLLS